MSVLALPESHPGFLYGIPRGESALQVVVVLHRARDVQIDVAASAAPSADHQAASAHFADVVDLLAIKRKFQRSCAEWPNLRFRDAIVLKFDLQRGQRESVKP